MFDSSNIRELDYALKCLEVERTLSVIEARERREKAKSLLSEAVRKIYAIESREKSKKAELKAELEKIEEQQEKKKAEYVEKMKNEVTLVNKKTEEKPANIETKREEILKAYEIEGKYQASGTAPTAPMRVPIYSLFALGAGFLISSILLLRLFVANRLFCNSWTGKMLAIGFEKT